MVEAVRDDGRTTEELHPKDKQIIEAVESLEEKGIKARRLVAGLLRGGAELINFVGASLWIPTKKRLGGEREYILPTGVVAISFPAEGLRQGLEYQVVARGRQSLGIEPLFMIPCFECNNKGKIDPQKSYIFLLNDEQRGKLEAELAK